jgi:hypothetical protein
VRLVRLAKQGHKELCAYLDAEANLVLNEAADSGSISLDRTPLRLRDAAHA